MIPVFVTSFGRDSMLDRCVKSLRRFDFEIHIIDNQLNGNEFRHLAAWGLGYVPTNGPYIVTDGDCAITDECPDDLIERLLQVLDDFPDVSKVGLGINTANFLDPPPERYRYSYEMERLVSQYPMLAPGIRNAPVDTTFALYRSAQWPGIGGVRLEPPYLIEHLPWLNPEYTQEEKDYYNLTGATWARTHSAASQAPPKVLVPFTALRSETIVGLGNSDIEYEMVARPITDDEGYFFALGEAWTNAEPFIVVEHDIVVRPETLRELRDCPEDWCAVPYPYMDKDKAWGLGCVRFSDPLMARNPEMFQAISVPSDSLHPPRHWCRMDVRIWDYLRGRGEKRHDHPGPALGHVGHRGISAHGCVRIP